MELVIEKLSLLGMSDHVAAFEANGFDSWETVLDVTESDLLVFLSGGVYHNLTEQNCSGSQSERQKERKISGAKKLAHFTIDSNHGKHVHRTTGSDVSNAQEESASSSTAESGPRIQIAPKRKYTHRNKGQYALHALRYSFPRYINPSCSDKAGLRLPLNAYTRFAKDQHKKYDSKEWSFAQRVKLIGEAWSNLDIATKRKYIQAATDDHATYKAARQSLKSTTAKSLPVESINACLPSILPELTEVAESISDGFSTTSPSPSQSNHTSKQVLHNSIQSSGNEAGIVQDALLDDIHAWIGSSDDFIRTGSPQFASFDEETQFNEQSLRDEHMLAFGEACLPSLVPNIEYLSTHGNRVESSEATSWGFHDLDQFSHGNTSLQGSNASTMASPTDEDPFSAFMDLERYDQSSNHPAARPSETCCSDYGQGPDRTNSLPGSND
ncbi:hypothetical protein FH972_025232 [Carpinus fangiana]|uniref:HMG box domain-containing protein n=1 Tax=Carpinus fangiana TaxID=176857 RepID=A0A5N6L0E9_9ROSI|nr:hypothetical protein FH972_025232 [Carpinus fangiana]